MWHLVEFAIEWMAWRSGWLVAWGVGLISLGVWLAIERRWLLAAIAFVLGLGLLACTVGWVMPRERKQRGKR